MTGGKMFDFITKTWNPIAGGFICNEETGELSACPYLCSYCWARGIINRFQHKKYQGPYRIHQKVARPNFTAEDTVFVYDMGDIGAPGIPEQVILDVFKEMKHQIDENETSFLLMTKNPSFYITHASLIKNIGPPGRVMLGATIETDRAYIASKVSKAPSVYDRMNDMRRLKKELKNPRFISVEPVMQFSSGFYKDIIGIDPWAVAIGYDNYHNQLEEPTLKETEQLIDRLEDEAITVWLKTLRERWHP